MFQICCYSRFHFSLRYTKISTTLVFFFALFLLEELVNVEVLEPARVQSPCANRVETGGLLSDFFSYLEILALSLVNVCSLDLCDSVFKQRPYFSKPSIHSKLQLGSDSDREKVCQIRGERSQFARHDILLIALCIST